MPKQDLTVKVERVCYPPETTEDATWFILKTDAGTCKGGMSWRPRSGERLILSGDYSVYQGRREFKFSSATLDMPSDPRAMLHYVCEIASGVGEVMETQIWELMEHNWPDIEAGEVPRLTGKTYLSFVGAIKLAELDREKAGAIAQLLAAGCSMNMASAAYTRWDAETSGVVTADPYRLTELRDYGFKHVDDSVRKFFKITDDDPRRIHGAMLYAMQHLANSGSTIIQWSELLTESLNVLGGYQELINAAFFRMLEEGSLKGWEASGKVALACDYDNELTVWNYIH
jgi:hypothetical protein